jgi:hypothetical protein
MTCTIYLLLKWNQVIWLKKYHHYKNVYCVELFLLLLLLYGRCYVCMNYDP